MTAVPSGMPLPHVRTARGFNSSSAAPWDAALHLAYEYRAGRTLLVQNRHSGPLVVQKPLYPEGQAVNHTVVLHPPGGIAGGDRLAITVDAARGCQVLLTTPGAAKWYKANSRQASQHIGLHAAGHAVLEWLPLESIVFDGADAQSSLAVTLDDGACAAGWDIVAFGRTASGERFHHGRFRQSIEIRRAGELLWAEYGELAGGDALFESPVGYAGRAVSGVFWIAGPAVGDDVLAICRERGEGHSPRTLAGVTRLPGGILLARCLCDTTEQARRHLVHLWTLLRPHYAGRAATVPRLWATA